MRRVQRILLFLATLLCLASCQDAEVLIPLAPAGLGVTDTEVTFGSSLALQGHAGYLGQETLRGAMSYLMHVNEHGGVHGRTVRIITRDDSYDPPKCLDNTQRFLIEDQVFGLFCYVGTPTTVKILPLVEESQAPLLGMFTGANALREPFMPYLINVRASYYQETNAAVEHLVQDLKLTRIAVFYQYDAFGFDGLTGTELALKRFGLEPVARGSYVRGTHDISEGLERIRESGAEAVVMIGTSDPCANFIRKSLENDYSPIFYMVSFVGAKELSRNLLQSETSRVDVIMSQVVPPPISRDGTIAESASEFAKLLEKYYPGEEPNFVGFEGYINAKVLVEGLRRAGRELTRQSFLDAIASMTDFSLGGDVTLTFGPQDHQGMDKVYFTRLQEGRFIMLDDWAELARGAAMKPYARISLKNKIFVSILAVILIISVTIALLARWILISGLTKELEQRGVAVAHSIAERGGGFVLDKNYPELLSLIFEEARLRERQHMINYIFVLDRSDQVLSHTFTVPFPAPLSTANPVLEGNLHSVRLVGVGSQTSYDIAVSMNEGLYHIGTVHVGLSKEHIDKLVAKLRFMFLGFISAVIIIIFYVSHRISRYITSPIARLTNISDELSRGNFDVHLDLGEGLDWAVTNCPAYKDTNMPCWHFDEQGRKSRKAEGKTGQVCATCLFYRKREGDEVIQLADSFMSMVWSIRLYRKRLQESEMKYRSLFDSGPDPIFVVDCNTDLILDANPRAEELYEYSKGELLGLSFMVLGQDQVRECLTSLNEAITNSGCVYYPKVLHYKKGERPFYVNMHACPISYGGTHAMIVAVTDITEMMEKDAQLVQAAKMKTLGEMSAGIAHEINQPLNAIKMGSEYLNLLIEQNRQVTETQIRDMATEISQQVDRATDIINNLRAFGKKSGLVMERVDMNEPIRGVLSIIGRQFSIQRITIRLELGDGLPFIKGHNNRLQQVFFNLLNNARDAIQEKMDSEPGMWGDILVRTYAQDGRVFATFADNGPGIPDSVRNKIFEPFFTTKQTGKGMGLGLAITYGIVRDYGGTITIDSQPGQGTTFILSFPVAESHQASEHHASRVEYPAQPNEISQ